MTLLIATIIFILGTAIGSFLSVIIYRIHKNKKGIIASRSICPSCKKKLKARHLVPVFSWLFLRGKCAYCREKISSHYLILELATGLLFLSAFLTWNFIEIIPSTIDPTFLNYEINWKIFEIFIFYIIVFTFLIAIFFYDLMYRKIPDKISLPAIAIAIAGGLILKTTPALSMLIGGFGLFAFFALQLIISKGKWIGGGDLRLGALMGVLLGWQLGLVALIIAYFLGSIVSIILLIQKKATRKTAIPFGPFLIIGIFIAIFYGKQILEWYLSTLML
jgi:prepilin signal peptidase PulO-like enzyme (type II secretory pathway)